MVTAISKARGQWRVENSSSNRSPNQASNTSIKMARDQFDCEVEKIALVEASRVFGNTSQEGFA
jgi:hypothetical protein